MTDRNEVIFPVDDGVELGAWLYLPKSDALPCPAIMMAALEPKKLVLIPGRQGRPDVGGEFVDPHLR